MSATRALLVLLALLLAGCDSETWWPRLLARGGGGTTLDFTNQADADAALVYSRTGGDAYLQSGASALKKLVAGSGSLWEDRGDSWGPGVWTWPAYTDDIAGQFCGAGWTRQGALSVVAHSSPAPYATASANKLVAASNADGCFRAMASGPPYRQGSIWIKDVAGSAPTSPGAWQINTTGVGQATNLLTGTTWRRISYAQNGGFAAIYVAGKQPTHPLFELGDNRGGVTSTAASGSLYAWGAHSTIGDVPLVDRSTGITDVHLAAGPLAQVISPTGDLDIELVVENVFLNYDFVDNTRDAYLFSATSPDGPMSLRYEGTTGEWKFAIRGADVLTATQWGPGPQFTDMKVRVTYKPSDATASLTFWMAGADQVISDATGTTTGAALKPLTNFWLGSNGGTSSGYGARWRSLKVDGAASSPELMLLGDSITAFFPSPKVPWPMMGSHLYTLSEARSRAGIVSLAAMREMIPQQRKRFLASPYRASVGYVYIQIGTNDLLSGRSAATIIRRLQRLVNTVRAVNPTCKILIGLITPAKSYFNALTVGAHANWSTVNTAISGGGETPITGVDARVTSYNTTLNDGADDILPQYVSADLLHPNQYAKQYVIAPDVRKMLDSVGF